MQESTRINWSELVDLTTSFDPDKVIGSCACALNNKKKWRQLLLRRSICIRSLIKRQNFPFFFFLFWLIINSINCFISFFRHPLQYVVSLRLSVVSKKPIDPMQCFPFEWILCSFYSFVSFLKKIQLSGMVYWARIVWQRTDYRTPFCFSSWSISIQIPTRRGRHHSFLANCQKVKDSILENDSDSNTVERPFGQPSIFILLFSLHQGTL